MKLVKKSEGFFLLLSIVALLSVSTFVDGGVIFGNFENTSLQNRSLEVAALPVDEGNFESGFITPASCSSVTPHSVWGGACGVIDIKANGSDGPITVPYNTAVNLTWTSALGSDFSFCYAYWISSSVPVPCDGGDVVTPLANQTYTIQGSSFTFPYATDPQDSVTVTVLPPQCSDGIDNDNPGDGLIDYPADPGCSSSSDNDETNPPQCSDSIDNENPGDGLIDYPADPGCSSSSDNDETDPLLPDLTAGTPTPGTVDAFSQQTSSSTISNIGSASTGANFRNFFQAATGPQGSGTIVNYLPTTMGNLSADSNAVASKKIDTSFFAGTYSIRACADKANIVDAGTIVESNENNNCSGWRDVNLASPQCSNGVEDDGDGLIDYPADPGCSSSSDNDEMDAPSLPPSFPDLTAGTPTPGTATVDVPQIFSSTISNNGLASTGASFQNFFQIATQGSGTITDLSPTTMGTLLADSNAVTSKSYIFPLAGTYSIRACADKANSSDDGTIVESNENNNCGVWRDVVVTAPPPQCSDGIDNDNPGDGLIDYPADPGCSSSSDNDETDAPPPSFPDLIVAALSRSPATPLAGGYPQTINGTIRNQGAVSTGVASNGRFCAGTGGVDLGGCYTGALPILSEPNVGVLGSPGGQDVTGAWTAVSNTTYNIYLCADVYNSVSESSETAASNCRSIQIVVPPECSDGVDNDDDGAIDASDPGCSGGGDNTEQSALPSVNFGASPGQVSSGGSSSISWTVSNVLDCTVLGTNPPGDSWSSGAVGGVPQTFTEETGPITQTTIYTLLCHDLEGGVLGAQTIIRVQPTFEEF